MISVVVFLIALCQQVHSGSASLPPDDIARVSSSPPRRFGSPERSNSITQSRNLREYDHPAEREGVDLTSFKNVDFRYAVTHKQADSAALVTGITGDPVVSADTDTGTDLVKTDVSEETDGFIAPDPPANADPFAEKSVNDVVSPIAAVPISYQVRIGDDGELDGGEDFGDHSDYESADVEEDYGDEAGQADWTAPTSANEDSGVGVGVHGEAR